MKRQWINIIIAVFLTIITAFFVEKDMFDKYKIDTIVDEKKNNNVLEFYNDLNFDGKLENIEFILKKIPGNAIHIKHNEKYLNLFNLSSNETFLSSFLSFRDIDSSGVKEILYVSGYDSVAYLNILKYEPENNHNIFLHKSIFIDSFKYHNKIPDANNSLISYTDNNEVVLNLVTGFSIQPRNLYKINIHSGEVIKSPITGINITSFKKVRYNNAEYFLITYNIATGNTITFEYFEKLKNSDNPDTVKFANMIEDFVFEYGDFSSYTILFNENLNFVFEPIEHFGWTNCTYSDIIKINNEKHIVSLTISEADSSFIPVIEICDFKGNIVDSVKLKNYMGIRDKNLLEVNPVLNEILIYNPVDEKITVFNNKLEKIKSFKLKNVERFFGFQDLNNDEVPELIVVKDEEILIYQNDLKVLTKQPLEYYRLNKSPLIIDVIDQKEESIVNFELGDKKFLFKYHKNKFYYFKFIFFVLIFFFWYLLIFLIQKIHTKKLAKENLKLEKIVKQRTDILYKQNIELQQQAEELKLLNDSLTNQKNQIIEQRDAISYQNRTIGDSINYASKIQRALLPQNKFFNLLFQSYFIIYKPKDIVSGDFYYLKIVNDYIILAVADCTGHGVPAAFISILGIAFLNEIIRKQEIKTAACVLEELRENMKNALKQTGNFGEAKDGMDITFCVINRKNNQLQYSGAFCPMFIVRNNKINELKPTKNPIGIYYNEISYKNELYELKVNDRLYLFTDGYYDQLGGDKNSRFYFKNFKKLIFKNSDKPLSEQKNILQKNYNNWKGNFEQVDDVLVIGIEY